MVENENSRLQYMKQYHIDRDMFRKIVSETIGYDNLMSAFDYGEMNQSYNFAWFRYDGEFYIVHKDSGMMINWYKHTGRTNTCSQDFRTVEDYYEFFKMFKEELEEWASDNHYKLG